MITPHSPPNAPKNGCGIPSLDDDRDVQGIVGHVVVFYLCIYFLLLILFIKCLFALYLFICLLPYMDNYIITVLLGFSVLNYLNYKII